jgi:hypothetical protein
MKRFPLIYALVLAGILFFSACSKTSSSLRTGGTTYSLAPGGLTSSTGGGNGGNASGDTTQHPAGLLTAAEWNDHDHWDFWLGLMGNDTFAAKQQDWGFACTNRWSFTVTDANGNPATDAVINIFNGKELCWVCHTNKFGVARFVPVYPAAQPLSNLNWKVYYNNKYYASGGLQTAVSNIACTLPVAAQEKTAVDIMFVVDATGSMGDELDYLKNELYDVLNRTEKQLAYNSLRYGAVFYRDRNSGDPYITKPHDFTSNKSEIVSFVKDQSADGGGDYPEAVDEALDAAMQQQWSASAKARIIFLVLDAPPHDAKQNLELYQASIQKAAEKGIMIIPVGASGIDKPTEFLMRFTALATNGTYTFLTNDSGIGNDHITPTTGPYTVEFLNDLMVRLITKYAGR